MQLFQILTQHTIVVNILKNKKILKTNCYSEALVRSSYCLKKQVHKILVLSIKSRKLWTIKFQELILREKKKTIHAVTSSLVPHERCRKCYKFSQQKSMPDHPPSNRLHMLYLSTLNRLFFFSP